MPAGRRTQAALAALAVPFGVGRGSAFAVPLAAALAACGEPSQSAGASEVKSSPVRLQSAAPPVAPAPASTLLDPNPLGLPPRRVTIDPGKRVFTFSEPMLHGAKLGSTLVLYGATVVGFEGDDLIIEGKGSPSYKVHAGYAIPVPDDARIKPGDVVLTEWNTVMRHAVVTKLVKDKVGVRFTDLDTKMAEVLVQGGRVVAGQSGPSKAARFVKQVEGLEPGNYAALDQGSEWKHVLLVSPAPLGDKKRWFCLGFGGAAMIADEADMKPIPVRYAPKVGATVWAEWTGTMRKATVQSADDPGLFTVKYERAGRPRSVGFGLLMPPLGGGKD